MRGGTDRLIALTLLTVNACASLPAYAADDATVVFRVFDENGNTLPCRIHAVDSAGQAQKANGLPFWADHFACPGEARLQVRRASFRWQIKRGPEYRPIHGSMNLAVGDVETVTVRLKRHTTLRDENWYCGDVHVHRPVAEIEHLMLAENLDFAPVIEWWNARGGDAPPVQNNAVEFADRRIYQLRGGEDERESGELLYFDLDQPLDLQVKSREFPSPKKFVKEARQRHQDTWIDIEKPFCWDARHG